LKPHSAVPTFRRFDHTEPLAGGELRPGWLGGVTLRYENTCVAVKSLNFTHSLTHSFVPSRAAPLRRGGRGDREGCQDGAGGVEDVFGRDVSGGRRVSTEYEWKRRGGGMFRLGRLLTNASIAIFCVRHESTSIIIGMNNLQSSCECL